LSHILLKLHTFGSSRYMGRVNTLE